MNMFSIPGRTGAVGYGRPGGLRPSEAALLPRHRRDPHVFLHRLARLAGEHPGKVDARGQTLLPQRTYHTRGKQKGEENVQWKKPTRMRL